MRSSSNSTPGLPTKTHQPQPSGMRHLFRRFQRRFHLRIGYAKGSRRGGMRISHLRHGELRKASAKGAREGVLSSVGVYATGGEEAADNEDDEAGREACIQGVEGYSQGIGA